MLFHQQEQFVDQLKIILDNLLKNLPNNSFLMENKAMISLSISRICGLIISNLLVVVPVILMPWLS